MVVNHFSELDIMILFSFTCPYFALTEKWQDLADAASSEEIARYLDLKKLDERVYMFEAVSAYNGSVCNCARNFFALPKCFWLLFLWHYSSYRKKIYRD